MAKRSRKFSKDPYLFGFEAFYAGFVEVHNPFPYPSQNFSDWERGWNAALVCQQKHPV